MKTCHQLKRYDGAEDRTTEELIKRFLEMLS